MTVAKVIVLLLYVTLIITIDIIHALQFLPFLTNRLASSKRLDHKLVKEINELEFPYENVRRRPPLQLMTTASSAASAKKLPLSTNNRLKSRQQVQRKPQFKLDDFVLDDAMRRNERESQEAYLDGLPEASVPPNIIEGNLLHLGQPVWTSNCDKTRVAAGTSGYRKVKCSDLGVKLALPRSLVLRANAPSRLQQLENPDYKRVTSNFEQLVDALTMESTLVPKTSR